jgi:hypothetical protein
MTEPTTTAGEIADGKWLLSESPGPMIVEFLPLVIM